MNSMPNFHISGTFKVLQLYEVAEEIKLDELRDRIVSAHIVREHDEKEATPENAPMAPIPVIENIDSVPTEKAEWQTGRIKYYDYGVITLELDLCFEGSWNALVELTSRWIGDPEIQRTNIQIVKRHIERLMPALVRPYKSWLTEDYYIIHLEQAHEGGGPRVTADALLQRFGTFISQVVRGEKRELSNAEQSEVLQAAISYYPSDLLIVGWTAALVYDTAQGATAVLQLLEHANAHLLELRHYDGVLTKVLSGVYRYLGRRGVFWRRGLAREAYQLNKIRLDIKELTERADVSLKFLSDMFYARVYRLASTRIGVPDYRNLVEDKLRTAADLYEFMVSEFHQSRAFVLELMVVIILIIDLVFLFRGNQK